MADASTPRGARNPFALAELRLKKRVDWKALKPEERRRLLEEGCECDYLHIFGSSDEAPLYAPLKDPERWMP